jgi:uncharacterized protein (TIGR02646 family)
MRYIQKQNPPRLFTEWIQKNKHDINFGYNLLRKDTEVIQSLSDILLKEQYYLCAYTGLRLDDSNFHIEHLKPQQHCERGEDVDYKNLVACYPGPNRTNKLPYGAHKKDNWPSPEEERIFITPLNPVCESKFQFTKDGKVNGVDYSANMTIEKLALNHYELENLRKSSLTPLLKLKRDEAAKRLSKMYIPSNGKLEDFCFAKKQVLEKQIKKLEAIIQSKSRKQT